MIAWDESPECWHAISAAIPFLKLAQSVRVISVLQKCSKPPHFTGRQVLGLAMAITVTAQIVAPDLRSVGDALLATAAECDAGLLVMGAYSHNRLREMLLGGATRDMLQNASSRPVLMAHWPLAPGRYFDACAVKASFSALPGAVLTTLARA